MPRKIITIPDKASKEDLEKIKLTEEIRQLRKPFWRESSFISILVTFIIASAGAGITIYELRSNQVAVLEKEKVQLEEDKQTLKVESEKNSALLNEAQVKQNLAIAKETEIQNKINEFSLKDLEYRERELKQSISEIIQNQTSFQNSIESTKRPFIKKFFNKAFVQQDISKYLKSATMLEGADWIESKLLFTALDRYGNYLLNEYKKVTTKYK